MKTNPSIQPIDQFITMSRAQKKETKQKICVHCKNTGESKTVYEGHLVRNNKGRVCCPKIMRNCCSKCSNIGHLPSYCTVVIRDIPMQFPRVASSAKVAPISKPAVSDAPGGKFAALMESSSEEGSPRKQNKKQPKDWCDFEDDDEDEIESFFERGCV